MSRELDQHLTDLCLAGKAHSPDVSKDEARQIVEARVHACIRVTGQTPHALRASEPARYERWLAGNRRALVRAGLVATGELSREGLAKLWSREQARRTNDQFDDMFDPGGI